MLNFTSRHRYFLHQGITDMRKSFNGLSALVNNEFTHSLKSKDFFIFINRRRNHIKLLMWDGSGFAIYHKRLEKGTFELPANNGTEKTLEITWTSLVFLLEGVQLKSVKMRKRYSETG